jgi:hypothetical protein
MRQDAVDRAALADQLQKLHAREGLADEGRLEREAPLLFRLAERLLALDGAIEQPLTPRAVQLIEDAIQNFSSPSQKLLSTGLNLDRQPDTNLEHRLRHLADEWGYSETRHLADRERSLYQPLADYIIDEVRVAQARHSHEALARGQGDRTAAALFVAEQFRYYYRIFTPMAAVGSDLTAYLVRVAREPDRPRPDELLDGAIYRIAQWEVALERFVQDLGGNWIASDADTETDLVVSLITAQRLLPFGDRDASLLRVALLEAPHSERQTFEAHLRTAGLYQRYRRRLRTWVLRCDCNPRRPKKSCEPHEMIKAIRQFTVLVDREWYRLGKWYQLPPATVSSERDDALNYFLHADPENYDLARLDRTEP